MSMMKNSKLANKPSKTVGAQKREAKQKRQETQKRMWGGRFAEETDQLVQEFNASITVDKHMALQDIQGSIAHATMLGEQGIITQREATQIIKGLGSIRKDVRAGTFEFKVELEDVHMNLERELTNRIGTVGGKLHTARSRNDQVATDFRLYVREKSLELIDLLKKTRGVFVDLAETHLGVIMPGYTHLQIAQPILFSHHMLAYYEMFTRDQSRVEDSLKRLNISPLGAGALAGTGFPIDRERTARLLGFSEPARNSLDAVSDRDFALEFLSVASILMTHLSRLSEELILWSSQEFGFVTLPDSHTTGSSIMPQKKNPDVSELIRGKTGRVYGNLMALLTVMKGLPLTYNKDMQEDKEGLMDSAETLSICLKLTISMLPKMKVNRERTYHAAGRGYSNATDLADYLAKKGLPFREAHEVVGQLVALGIKQGKDLQQLELAEMQKVSALIQPDVYVALKLENVVNVRKSYGGTALNEVKKQITKAKKVLAK
jgi:argininosuccinate lyase